MAGVACDIPGAKGELFMRSEIAYYFKNIVKTFAVIFSKGLKFELQSLESSL